MTGSESSLVINEKDVLIKNIGNGQYEVEYVEDMFRLGKVTSIISSFKDAYRKIINSFEQQTRWIITASCKDELLKELDLHEISYELAGEMPIKRQGKDFSKGTWQSKSKDVIIKRIKDCC